MKGIYARVILDSLAPSGFRLATLEGQIPRFILAEFNTHRRMTRSSPSSRAVPVELELQRLMEEPFIPTPFMKNQKGMSGNNPLDELNQERAEKFWLTARDKVAQVVKFLSTELKVHKQHANRLAEPFQYHKILFSSVTFDNFFWQRCSTKAQPEMKVFADCIKEALENSVPTSIPLGGWHMPFITLEERYKYDLELCKHVSVARCARISYRAHETERDIMEDVELATNTLIAGPHPAPFEHVAQAVSYELRSGNYVGWHQLRYDLKKHSGDSIDYEGVLLNLEETEFLLRLYDVLMQNGSTYHGDILATILERLGLFGLTSLN